MRNRKINNTEEWGLQGYENNDQVKTPHGRKGKTNHIFLFCNYDSDIVLSNILMSQLALNPLFLVPEPIACEPFT